MSILPYGHSHTPFEPRITKKTSLGIWLTLEIVDTQLSLPGSGAARLAAILAGVSPANSRSSGPVVVISSGRKGDRPNRKPGSRSPLGLGKPGLIRRRGASNLTGCSVSEPGSLEMRAPRETDCGNVGSAELLRSRRRPCRHRRPEP